jgi:hypothetical protein
MPYAADIRAGRHRQHPRHWKILAELIGPSASLQSSEVWCREGDFIKRLSSLQQSQQLAVFA